jgi:dienelactone hydrolase
MRRLEIAGTIGLFLYALHLFTAPVGSDATLVFFLSVAVLIIICHLWLEGYRWQMVPAYFVAVALPVYEIAHRLGNFQALYLFGSAIVLLILASIVLSTILPVFELPALTGLNKVGTQTRHLIDRSRVDPLSDHEGGPRELMIQIWYPAAEDARGQFAPYREKSITTFRSAHFSLVKTNSILGVPLSKGERFPVLLYTPSWSGIRTECTFQVEELASHGYVVVGIDHPYSSKAVAFPDGRIARRKFVGEEDYSSEAAVDSFLKTADQQIRLRTQDARFVLDVLERLNESDPERLLTGSLDLTRVGIFGFSLGGGTSAETCWLDRRFKAGLDMGGLIAGESMKQGTFAPFFFIFEGMYAVPPYALGANISSLTPSKRRDIEFTRKQFDRMKSSLSKFGGYWMTITHPEFCDSPFFSPLRRSSANPTEIARVINKYARAFFDKYLKNVDQPLLDHPTLEIPEVRLEVWTSASATRESQNRM